VAKAATQTIPIVFNIGSDPVEVGLVASLAHPGGNITGLSQIYFTLTAKRLEMMHELMGGRASIALLVNPTPTLSPRPGWCRRPQVLSGCSCAS